LTLPLRMRTAGGEQSQARALAIGVVEDARQQAFGLTQGAMTASGRRGIDDDQPQLTRLALALLPMQISRALRATLAQRRDPGDLLAPTAVHPAPLALCQFAPGLCAIRPQGIGRANAQGFFGQFGTSRRGPMASGCAGIAPHWPCGEGDCAAASPAELAGDCCGG